MAAELFRPMNDRDSATDLTRACRERDLFRRLLELGRCTELQPLIEEALGLVVELVGARRASKPQTFA
jgi:hypothetical protein